MSREIYECNDKIGVFSNARGNEHTQFDIPENARLDLRPATDYADWMTEAGIAYIVVQEPQTTIYYSGLVHGVHDHPTEDFPPSGGSRIYLDKSTFPANLFELIQERITRGWTMSPALEALVAQS